MARKWLLQAPERFEDDLKKKLGTSDSLEGRGWAIHEDEEIFQIGPDLWMFQEDSCRYVSDPYEDLDDMACRNALSDLSRQFEGIFRLEWLDQSGARGVYWAKGGSVVNYGSRLMLPTSPWEEESYREALL